MLNLEMLLEENQFVSNEIAKHIHFNKGTAYYNMQTEKFDGQSLQKVIYVISYITKKYSGNRFPIVLNLGKFYFSDKLVYILLECLCYYIINYRKQQIILNFNATHTIASEGIQFSPLIMLGVEKDYNTFNKKFKFDIQMKHFRKLIDKKTRDNSEYLSKLMHDVKGFLKFNNVDTKSCDELSEVIVELVGNAGEHGKTDCLFDLDITDNRYKFYKQEQNKYFGLNVSIVNFSEKLFNELLMERMKTVHNLPERYNYINQAEKVHKEYFNENYSLNDFYTIASFQHKISGSLIKRDTGGTGLTSLIKSLEERSKGHYCYMLSGNRIMFFSSELMKYDDKKFIGFNKEGNFLTQPPEMTIFQSIETYLPGTAYNLSFAIERNI